MSFLTEQAENGKDGEACKFGGGWWGELGKNG